MKDTTVGIICLTQENKNRPWILFEAGALAKGLSTARVCTLLIDLEPKDIEDPLAQFNHTFPNRESVLGLVRTLNGTLGVSSLDVRILEQVFNTYWPQFETRFKEVLASTESAGPAKPRPKEDVLGEILEHTRMLSSRIRKIEFDTDRARIRPDFDLSKKNIRAQIIEMMSAGAPPDLIMDELRHIAPRSYILEIIERNKNDKSIEWPISAA